MHVHLRHSHACMQVRWIQIPSQASKVHRYWCSGITAMAANLLPVLGDFGSEGAAVYRQASGNGEDHWPAAAAAVDACAEQLHGVLNAEAAHGSSMGRELEPCQKCVCYY